MSSLAGIFCLLLLFGVVAGFWVGLSGLRRAGCRVSWWIMAAGLASCMIGPLASLVGAMQGIQHARRNFSGSSAPPEVDPIDSMPTQVSVFFTGGGILLAAGLMLFAIGYALHAMRIVRIHRRAKELENLALARGEEANRFRQHIPRPASPHPTP